MGYEGKVGEGLRFAVSGGLTAFASWAICRGLLLASVPVGASGAVAYICSLPLGYVLHRAFSFQSKNPVRREGAKYLVLAAVSAAFAGWLLDLLNQGIGLQLELSLALVVCVVAPSNFLAMKAWVFMTSAATSRRMPS